jgi:hypothetical protein
VVRPESNLDVINATTVLRSGLLTIRLSGIETLSGVIDSTSGLDQNEYTTSSWSTLQTALVSGILVRDEILSSGALGRYEEAFITSGVIFERIDDLTDAFSGLRFLNFAEFETTLSNAASVVANSGIYTTESYNTFNVAYQSGLLYQSAINASGVVARVNDVQVVNADLITTKNAILTASGALDYVMLATNLTLFVDASDPASYSGTGSVWSDLSESNFDVTLSGVQYSAAFSGIMVFDGTAEAATASIVPVPTDLTLEAWFRTQEDDVLGKIIGFEGANGWDRYLSFNSSGTLVFGVWHSGVHVQATSSTVVNDGEWHHVIATYDSGLNELRLYLNGVLESTIAATVDHEPFGYNPSSGAGLSGSGLSVANNMQDRTGA